MTDQLVALAREAEQLTKENIDLRHKLRAAESRLTQLEGALRNLRNQVQGANAIAHHEILAAIGVTNARCIERALAEADAALTPVVKQPTPPAVPVAPEAAPEPNGVKCPKCGGTNVEAKPDQKNVRDVWCRDCREYHKVERRSGKDRRQGERRNQPAIVIDVQTPPFKGKRVRDRRTADRRKGE